MVAFLILQNIVFSHITILGVRAFFLPSLLVAVGMFENETRSAVFGMIMGIICDICYPESTIMYTILFSLLGLFFGYFANKYINNKFLPFMIASLVCLIITGLVQTISTVILFGAPILKVLSVAGLQTLWAIPVCVFVYPSAWFVHNRIETIIRKKAGEQT